MWIAFRPRIRGIRGTHFHPCENRYRRRQFQPRDSHPHRSRAHPRLGNRLYDRRLPRHFAHRAAFLIYSHSIPEATGLSWLCYFGAQIGDVSKVAPIDKFSIVPHDDPRLRRSRRTRHSESSHRRTSSPRVPWCSFSDGYYTPSADIHFFDIGGVHSVEQFSVFSICLLRGRF